MISQKYRLKGSIYSKTLSIQRLYLFKDSIYSKTVSTRLRNPMHEAFIFRIHHHYFQHYFKLFLWFYKYKMKVKEIWSKMKRKRKSDDMSKKMMIYPKNKGLASTAFLKALRLRQTLEISDKNSRLSISFLIFWQN